MHGPAGPIETERRAGVGVEFNETRVAYPGQFQSQCLAAGSGTQLEGGEAANWCGPIPSGGADRDPGILRGIGKKQPVPVVLAPPTFASVASAVAFCLASAGVRVLASGRHAASSRFVLFVHPKWKPCARFAGAIFAGSCRDARDNS